MKFSHPVLIVLSGLLWLAVGLYLLPLGMHFLIDSGQTAEGNFTLINSFASLGVTSESASLLLIALGLAIGTLKSRLIFSKTVERGVSHIRSLPEKASLTQIYTPKYLLLLALMILLGLSMKWLSVPLDIRGLIDVAVATALINGAMMYFRKAAQFDKINNKLV